MAFDRHISNYIQEHRPLFTAVLVGLFLLELEILVIAAARSGPTPSLIITDTQGRIVYEAVGRDLDTFDPAMFEKIFGPLEGYHVQRVSRNIPFPFRAWFVASVGIPLGGMLLFAFIVRAFVAVFQGDKRRYPDDTVIPPEQKAGSPENRLDRILDKIGRLNIFAMGFLIFLIVISYWILPNTMVYLGRTGIDTVRRYRWFFLAGGGAVFGVFIWIVYLRYLLAKKHMESQTKLEKYRLEFQFGGGSNMHFRLPPPAEGASSPPPSRKRIE